MAARTKAATFLLKVANRLLRPYKYRIADYAAPTEPKLVPDNLTLLLSSEHWARYFKLSRSQAGQDWIVWQLYEDKPEKGFFVEFGAVDGVQNSNSYFLENALGWDGIVAEPARRWHKELAANRGCAIETDCVYATTGETLSFAESGKWSGGNTLLKHLEDDGGKRKISATYDVKTISLNDMLEKHSAPEFIDFISIDTEGSEFEILQGFDFSKARFGLLCVEHNYVDDKRSMIKSLLEENGYKQLPMGKNISGVDDWYANEEMFDAFVRRFQMLSN